MTTTFSRAASDPLWDSCSLHLLIFQDFGHGFAVHLQNPPLEVLEIWEELLIAHVWAQGTGDAPQGGASPLGQESLHGLVECLSQGWF